MLHKRSAATAATAAAAAAATAAAWLLPSWFWMMLLLLRPVVAVSATHHVDTSSGPPCNTVMGIITVADLERWTYASLRRSMNNETLIEEAAQEFLNVAQYDLLASKACSSCRDLQDLLNTSDTTRDDDDNSNSNAWSTYCGSDVYGFNATHSALVLHPLDPSTGLPLTGRRHAVVGFPGTQGFDLERAASTLMGTVLSNSNNGNNGTTTNDDDLSYLTDDLPWHFLFGASAGLIGIGVDYLGTAASAAEDYDRSYLTKMPVQQAAVVGFHAAVAYTQNITQGCTQLDPNATLTIGYSAGGAAVIFGTLALQAQGITISQCFSQAGVYSNVAIVQGVVGAMIANPTGSLSPQLAGYIGIALAAYSNEAPYLPNTGTGQTLMSEAWLNASSSGMNDTSRDILGWVYEEKINAFTMRTRFPTLAGQALTAINPNIIQPIITASQNGELFCQPPHVTVDIAALCAALFTNEPFSILSSQVNYPIEWCHSPDDPTIPLAFTQFFLLAPLDEQASVTAFAPPVESLTPRGDHGDGERFCEVAIAAHVARNPSILQATPINETEAGEDCPVPIDLGLDNYDDDYVTNNTTDDATSNATNTTTHVPTSIPTAMPTVTASPTAEPVTGSPSFEPSTLSPSSATYWTNSILIAGLNLIMAIPLMTFF